MVKESTSEEHMAREYSAILGGYVSSKELFSHLEEGGLDAIVHDLATLEYYANTKGKGKVKIVGKMFNKQDYGFLYPENSRVRELSIELCLNLLKKGLRAPFAENGLVSRGRGDVYLPVEAVGECARCSLLLHRK